MPANISKSRQPRFWAKWQASGAIGTFSSHTYQAPQAVVRKIDGQLVLDDPMALAVIRAVGKLNCKNTLDLNSDRVPHYKERIAARNLAADAAVIVFINVNDPNGGPIADLLMPGYDWQTIRDQGEVPFARGLADRKYIQEILEQFDQEAAEKLASMTEVSIVVVDHGVAEIFAA